ncbi:MAG: foldase protein PrsA [Solirubrobacteraceae bacterium]|jgi:foldase protein PrsA|nr:foldase protein PrsA [Solirubrobacteraceae bacterium]MEA2395489.1 foldase protein PrsA [Solirubrobacteraceae bacterium]
MLKSRFLAPCAFFVVALVVSACGGGVPGNAVVSVDSQTIKKTTFDHWMRIAAISSQGQANPNATTAPTASVPDAPDFKQCIARLKATTKPAKGQPEPSDANLKTQCQQQFNGLKTQVLQFLIRATWLDNEATKQGVKVSDKDAQTSIDGLKKQQFPKEQDYQKFLRASGLTNEDVIFQQRTTLLEQKLTQKVTRGKNNVTDAQIAAYYNKNKQRFATPERRDLRIVLTKTQGDANNAKAALASGQSWKTVAKTSSIDQASKANGGVLKGVAKGQQEQALDTAVFAAAKGKLSGPVKTQFGWYVFEVTAVTPAKQQTLDQSKTAIKQLLASQNQQSALKTFGDGYRKRWKAKTDCRSGYKTEDCKGEKNAPAAPAQQQQQVPQTGQTQP